jgi:hypothetical protein
MDLLSTAERQELWSFSHSLIPENPSMGIFKHNTLFYGIKLRIDQQNWLMTNVSSPDICDHQWLVKSLMLRYRSRDGNNGGIDIIGIRDANMTLHQFTGEYRDK